MHPHTLTWQELGKGAQDLIDKTQWIPAADTEQSSLSSQHKLVIHTRDPQQKDTRGTRETSTQHSDHLQFLPEQALVTT